MQTIETPAPLPAEAPPSAQTGRFELGVVGCGDVAFRRYLRALAALADYVEPRLPAPRETAARGSATRGPRRPIAPPTGLAPPGPTSMHSPTSRPSYATQGWTRPSS